MSDELRALDREWAVLAGWVCTQEAPSGWAWEHPETSSYRWMPLEGTLWSSDPNACLGPGGPWEWLEKHGSVGIQAPNKLVRDAFCVWVGDGRIERLIVRGTTIFEAITRCAIEARRKLEGPRA